MRAILLLGACAGTVINVAEASKVIRMPKREDVSLILMLDSAVFETLWYEYVLIAHDDDEAYYAPKGFNSMQIIRGLLSC